MRKTIRPYWAVSTLLLLGTLLGCTGSAVALVAVSIIHGLHFIARTDPRSFPSQVRLAWFALLLAGLWPPLTPIHWIMLVGTSARLLTDYCLLARLIALLPWNRRTPLSAALVCRAVLSPPRPGPFTAE